MWIDINERLECPNIFTWMKVIIFMGQFTSHVVQQQIPILIHHLAEVNLNVTRQYDIIRGPHFQGNSYRQDTILSGYGYGMICSTFISGYVSLNFSCYNLILSSFLVSAYFVTLSAPSVFLHWLCLFSCRVILGFTSGIQNSALEVLDWAWNKHKARNSTKILSGRALGSIFCIFLTVWVSHDINWMWGFYICALLIVLYCITFYNVATNHPKNHPRVPSNELIYISQATEHVESILTIWELLRRLTRNKYFWSMCFGFFGYSWNETVMVLLYPIFIYRVIDSNSTIAVCLIGSLPHVFKLTSIIMFGYLKLYEFKHKLWQPNRVLKRMIFIAHILPGMLQVLITLNYLSSLAMKNKRFLMPEVFVVVLISIAEFFHGMGVTTVYENPRLLTKNNFTFLFSIMTFFGSVANILVPMSNHFIVYNKADFIFWGRVFGICGVINIITGAVYMATSTTKDQNW